MRRAEALASPIQISETRPVDWKAQREMLLMTLLGQRIDLAAQVRDLVEPAGKTRSGTRKRQILKVE